MGDRRSDSRMSSKRRLMDGGDAMQESCHPGEISTRSGISASPGLIPLARSSRAISAKQGAVVLTEFIAKPFIHSTPCDPDPRRCLLARSQRHYLAEKGKRLSLSHCSYHESHLQSAPATTEICCALITIK